MSRKTRKLIWSAPLVAVLAVAGALTIFAALGPGTASANQLPAAPGELTVTTPDGDAGRTTLVLNWGAAADASGYRIDKVDGSGAVWETFVMDTGNADTSYTDDTLTASDTRWYRVFALNSHGIGPVSNAASGSTDAKINPGPVLNLTAMPNPEKPYTQIDLSWDPPAANGGEKIVGYEVQFHNGSDWGNLVNATTTTFTASTATTDQVTVTTKTMITDTPPATPVATKLDPGDTRLYRVRAINGPSSVTAADSVGVAEAALGSRSKEWNRVEGMTKAATEPGQVTGLTAVNATDASINLYWYDPEDTGGWDISGYVIQAHRPGKRFPSAPSTETIKDETFSATAPTLGSGDNLNNATWYQTKPATPAVIQATFGGITAVDHDGNTETAARQVKWYFRVYAVTTDDGPDDATTATPADAVNTDNVIRRSGSPSDTAGDTPATREIDHDNDGGTTAALDPLAPPSLSATPDATATPPTEAKKQQIDLSVTVATALSGATPPVEQIAYRIDYSDDAGDSWKLLERDTRFTGFGPDRDYEDDGGLGFDESRSYRIFAIGDHPYTDVGPAQADIITGMTAASTAPKAPTGVTASSPSLTSIMASWTAPEDNGGQPVVKYLVQWVPDDGDDVAEDDDFDTSANANADAADLDDTVTSDAMTMGTFDLKDIADADALEADTVYVLRVAGVNKVDGTGADRPVTDPIAADGTTGAPNWSMPVLFDTTEAAKPNMVEGLTSEDATDRSGNSIPGVNLLWNKPSDKISITDYDIEVQDEHGDWANPEDGENWTATRTSYTDPDEPEADEVRLYRVRASNEAGHGPWAMVYFPREPDTHTHVAAMGEIPAQEVTVGMTTTVNAAMYFSDNTGAMYEAESDMEQYATVDADASSGMLTITGVAEGTATITVTATSGAVMAEQEFMVTVMAAALGAPMNVMAMVDDSDPGEPDVIVTWTDGENSDAHWVGLYDIVNNRTYSSHRVAGDPSAMTHTFANVEPGIYLPAVISTLEGFTPMVDYARQDDGRPMLTTVGGQ